MMPPIHLVIFEDNGSFRESLSLLFHYVADIEVVGAYVDCSDLRNIVQTTQPQVILMDVDMPGINGIDATAIVKEIAPATQVVILTVSEEEERIFKALRNGATGYLLKKSTPDEIIEAVRAVCLGGSPMSPAIARKVLRFFQELPPEAPKVTGTDTTEYDQSMMSGLTPREQEILEGLVDGLSYKMIANQLFISPDTVKNHIQGVYRKLHVNSKGEAISYALRNGIAGKRG